MDNNDAVNESLDSVPQPTYEALDEVEVDECTDAPNTMETEETSKDIEEEPENGSQYHSDHDDIDKLLPKKPSSRSRETSEEKVIDNHTEEDHEDDEEYSHEYEEEEEEISEEYVQDESQSYVEDVVTDNKHDPLIVQGNDGMIKKIKICNKDNVDQRRQMSDIKGKKSQNVLQNEVNKILQPRSSTPLSREYLALQRSVNESKILTEFVTDAANEKPRKLRTKECGNSVAATSTTDHSYSSVRKGNQLTPEKALHDDSISSISPSQGRRQHNKRYAPLKDSDSDVESSSNFRSRSRSKSMHNSEYSLTAGPHKKLKKWPSEERSKSVHDNEYHKKLKKWPSEERLNKRTNMRSENSEFAQKQFEFLRRVIHASETPRSPSRSRSRSGGRSKSCKTPTLFNDTCVGVAEAGEEVGVSHKSHKVVNKERYGKRNKHEIYSGIDEQPLSQVSLMETSEQPDDVSVNESNASLVGISSIGDTAITENDIVEANWKSTWQPPLKPGYDSFCWKCHESNVNLCCSKCVRSFHTACAKLNKLDNTLLCLECTALENLLNNSKRSRRNELSLDLLSQLLSFALKRMRYAKGHYNFRMPYEETTNYKKYILNPVTLTSLQAKIEAKEFRCAEEFVNETKWMLHNAYILSSRINTKTVMTAKSLFKICRQEANEIETCAECYLNANTRTDWFVDVCSQPHLLLWAKLKGFPYWPAKAMGLGQNSLINVRFFGEHDRAFVPLKDCFLYSVQDPNTATGKRAARELADCIKEVEEHIEKIRTKVGGFNYAQFKTPYDPAEEMKQLIEMMPGVEDFIKKQQGLNIKPSLQFKIYKTADNHLSIVQKASTTPELPSSSHDSEEKKKKSFGDLSELKKHETKLEENNSPPPKYKVISKVSSDDSNSSKLSTVILKRKSVNGDTKKMADDETVELPLPKMTKLEGQFMEEDLNKINQKRKCETQSVEKPKTKHNKFEPKIPIITIKTSLTNETKTPTDAESAKQMKEATAEKGTNGTAIATQKVVENLVKNKQGVTIKKISKDIQITSSPEQNTGHIARESPDKPKDKVAKQKAQDEKARENQKVNNILKGLVPFVEVKKEILSDNEEETGKQQKEKSSEKETNRQNNSNNTKVLPVSVTQEMSTNNNNAQRPTAKEGAANILTQVKEEIFSDEEEANTTPAAPTTKQPNNSSGEKQTTATNTNDVRVVGDTTIQKLSNKNNQNQYIVPSSSSSSGFGTIMSSNSNNINNSKRSSLKGIPYGPLPASAFPKSVALKSFQSTDVNFQPRAKKSFPQHSPPIEKLKPSTNQSTTSQIHIAGATNQHLDQKRTMAKNTMVTIPVDVATNRASTSAGTIIIGNIPVPPLTAVSKTTISTSVSHNSLARNTPATIIVSGTSGSLTTPSVIAQTKVSTIVLSTSPTTSRNSPITIATLTTPSSASQAPLITQPNQINPLTLSTPPPLAGLSNTSLINSQQQNGLNDNNNTATIASPATQPSSTDTHLLGGLVTPTLASAITDVICRGPPKLAVRPNGPLQAEGYPMFPSQAGPVCKRLVENVHKLTDFFISVVEDTMGEMTQGDDASLQAKITLLTMELERSKQAYEQEIAELKRTSDLMLCEMRKSMENEKTRLAIEIRKQSEMERLRSVEETKRKQWCANCFREANFYCCWNTSYCDYPCQQLHWSRHAHTCAQTRTGLNDGTSATSTLTNTTQHERHHAGKSNSSMTLSSSAGFNKAPTIISQKKEKGAIKNATNHTISTAVTAATTSRTNTEVLKLPTNTYLRPVTSTLNNQTLRCNTTYSIPVQRFNAPMPITTPANTSSPQTFTIVQQGNSWVMSTGLTNNSNNSNTSLSTNSATIAAPIASVPQVTGRTAGNSVGGTLMTNKSAKAQIRYH